MVEGLSLAQIAAEIFSSKEAVRAALKRFNIPSREPHKPHSRPSQPRYGKQIRSGKVSPHLAELQMIQTIMELRRQGLTLRKIAEVLTSMGVPTKKRGKSWHPQMIKRILQGGTAHSREQGISRDSEQG
ncbi:MAG: recombinase family protein [Bdellovibrionota bacterium]